MIRRVCFVAYLLWNPFASNKHAFFLVPLYGSSIKLGYVNSFDALWVSLVSPVNITFIIIFNVICLSPGDSFFLVV